MEGKQRCKSACRNQGIYGSGSEISRSIKYGGRASTPPAEHGRNPRQRSCPHPSLPLRRANGWLGERDIMIHELILGCMSSSAVVTTRPATILASGGTNCVTSALCKEVASFDAHRTETARKKSRTVGHHTEVGRETAVGSSSSEPLGLSDPANESSDSSSRPQSAAHVPPIVRCSVPVPTPPDPGLWPEAQSRPRPGAAEGLSTAAGRGTAHTAGDARPHLVRPTGAVPRTTPVQAGPLPEGR